MKTCPKCTVPFDDSFSFCEFDGTELEKVIQPETNRFDRRGVAIAMRVLVILVFVIGAVFIFGLGSKKKVQVAANQPKVSAPQEPTSFIETPQAAQDYVEPSLEAEAAEGQQKQETVKKPGVEVFKPETRESAGHSEAKNQPPPRPKPEVTEPEEPRPSLPKPTLNPTPNPTKTRIGERTPITRGSSSPVARQQEPPAPQERAPAPQERAPVAPPVNRTPQTTTNRPVVSDQPLVPAGTSSVSLNLVRIRSYRTDGGVRYEMTFTMREIGNGRMIQWQRLSLVSRSSSGITHAEAVPFAQRLGTSGSMTFTVSKEMRGSSEADWQGQISCTGIGTDIDGRAVRSTFTARVNP